jgi:hypothetical protein
MVFLGIFIGLAYLIGLVEWKLLEQFIKFEKFTGS